ncbi:hypothetical protein RhiJN_06550 [Ceratobasidium sp. AG-Ba]|nr:hypothetical protein RhiJN_06550 [Ceratobasidium sp. AG-Ba]
MSRIEPGKYIIYNRVQDEYGQRLALTFNGDKQVVTVTKLEPNDTKQHWEVVDRSDRGLQHIKPIDNTTLEAGWDGDYINTVHAGGQCWSISKSKGWAIQSGELNMYWSVDRAANRASIKAVGDVLGPQQRWIFVPVGHRIPE